jgi:hypothetical protein
MDVQHQARPNQSIKQGVLGDVAVLILILGYAPQILSMLTRADHVCKPAAAYSTPSLHLSSYAGAPQNLQTTRQENEIEIALTSEAYDTSVSCSGRVIMIFVVLHVRGFSKGKHGRITLRCMQGHQSRLHTFHRG